MMRTVFYSNIAVHLYKKGICHISVSLTGSRQMKEQRSKGCFAILVKADKQQVFQSAGQINQTHSARRGDKLLQVNKRLNYL